MQPSSNLAKRYGKLSVISTEVIDHHTVANVRCVCGRTKQVVAESLRAGKTKSCGHPPCKYDTNTAFDPDFVPRRPRVLTLPQVKQFWKSYHRVRARPTLADLAEKYGVNYHMLDGLLRSIRKSGGIDRYLQLLRRK